MQIGPAGLQSNASVAALPVLWRSLLFPPASALVLIVFSAVVVSHRFDPECRRSNYGACQTDRQSYVESRLVASDPTSSFSVLRCNRSSVFASSATLLLPAWRLVCCVDRLNPQPIADIKSKSISCSGPPADCSTPAANVGRREDVGRSVDNASM